MHTPVTDQCTTCVYDVIKPARARREAHARAYSATEQESNFSDFENKCS